MTSLNAGKSSRLVVTVEPCLGTQHLHKAKFPAISWGEMTQSVRLPIQIYKQLPVCWKWLQMLSDMLWQSKFVPKLLSEHWPNPIFQQPTFGDFFRDCLSSVRILGSPLHASHLNLLDVSKTEWHRAGQPNSPAKLQAGIRGMTHTPSDSWT